MDEITNPTTIWGAAGGAVAAAIAGIFWVRKMLASTAADVAGDRAEVNMITVLQQENATLRERLIAVEAERNEFFKQIASLQADLKIIQASQDSLTNRITELTQTNQALTQKVSQLSEALEAHR
jgi:peptidoglycan hydrolase CwlO-like protein